MGFRAKALLRQAICAAGPDIRWLTSAELRRFGYTGFQPCKGCGKPARNGHCFKCQTLEKAKADAEGTDPSLQGPSES